MSPNLEEITVETVKRLQRRQVTGIDEYPQPTHPTAQRTEPHPIALTMSGSGGQQLYQQQHQL